MNPESGKSISLWMTTARFPEFPFLSNNEGCDVCVIGAGITGLSAAYFLAKSGQKVIVLEDGPVCGGETQRTTAHLTDVVDDRYCRIEKMHGVEKAQLVYKTHRQAISLIERNISNENIACDFMRLNGYLFTGDKESPDILENELSALHKIGYQGVELLEELPLQGVPIQSCLSFARQAQFHPLKYLNGLLSAITKYGGTVFTQTRVTDIKDGDIAEVQTERGFTVQARNVVIATNSPIGDAVRIHTKQAAYRTYAIAADIFAHSIPAGLYWDTEDPYHYVRLQRLDNNDEYETILIGGEDHRTGVEPDGDPYARLEAWAKRWFVGIQDVMYTWSGQVYEPADGLAFIGQDPSHGENVFLATGDSGMGMTHGTMAGQIIHDLILGRENPFTQLYAPSRIPMQDAGEFIKENVTGLVRYLDYATPGDVKSTADINSGEGSIVRRGLEKIACYKDENGICHEMSAVCPHMKGLVRWNETEKTWDCPVHGSRFTATGRVVNGPANSDLEPLAPESQPMSFDPKPVVSETSPAQHDALPQPRLSELSSESGSLSSDLNPPDGTRHHNQ